jgi:hypothetical protein
MASTKENIRALSEQRDRLLLELEALKNKLVGLDMAISILRTGEPRADTPVPAHRRSGVKTFILDLLKERGRNGLNAQVAVDIAATRGVLMDRASVSSLLSRLKQDGVVDYDGSFYRLKGNGAENLARNFMDSVVSAALTAGPTHSFRVG